MSQWTYKCRQCYRFFNSTKQCEPNESPLCGECYRQNLCGAAPELLAACKQFLDYYPQGINPDCDKAHRMARAAIARAEGRTP
jgi:hypothetical protein